MAIELLTSAEEFLARTYELRAADPYRTNILGSVATAVSDGSLTYDQYLWWVASDENRVIGAAMRTAPHGMVLSPMPDQAIGDLAHAVALHDDVLPSVSGPTSVVEKFIAEYKSTGSAGSRRDAKVEEELLLYALGKFVAPSGAGEMINAERSDFDLILQWYVNFGQDTGVFMPNPEGSINAGLSRGSYRFWIVDGVKVSLAGHAPLVDTPTGNIARIGPVYTPPNQRRRGYAGALTAALSKELLDQGARLMLYTDAKNPTSNSIYQKIGYEQIDQNAMFSFSVDDD